MYKLKKEHQGVYISFGFNGHWIKLENSNEITQEMLDYLGEKGSSLVYKTKSTKKKED